MESTEAQYYIPIELWDEILSIVFEAKIMDQHSYLQLRTVSTSWSTMILSKIIRVTIRDSNSNLNLAQSLRLYPNLTEAIVLSKTRSESSIEKINITTSLSHLPLTKLFFIDISCWTNSHTTIFPVLNTLTNLTSLRVPQSEVIHSLLGSAESFTRLKVLISPSLHSGSLTGKLSVLTQLTSLSIPGARLTPDVLNQIKNLTLLKFLALRITHCSYLSSLCHLTTVSLSEVQSLAGLHSVDTLSSLTLARSNMKSSDVQNLSLYTNLTKLSVKSDVRVIPRDLCRSCTKLRTLNLSSNKMRDIAVDIGLLTLLTFLDLSNNELRVLPSEVGSLVKLGHLYLDDNRIEGLPVEVGGMTNLWVLSVARNRLGSVPEEVLESMTQLRRLNVEGNLLSPEVEKRIQLRWPRTT